MTGINRELAEDAPYSYYCYEGGRWGWWDDGASDCGTASGLHQAWAALCQSWNGYIAARDAPDY